MFSKKNIKDIPVEATPHATGSRKLLVGKPDISSSYFEAFTYGYLPGGEKWAIHKHDNIVEICLVVKGSGVIRDTSGNTESFESGDRFIFPSDTEHEIENTSKEIAELYFFRVQDK
jgi:mannose-6-phosphate isomerase-like protein (cupin superfamily)